MNFQLAAFLRTTLPLDLSALQRMDDGQYHSVWLPDHMVSFWPDAIWTPEFTDLAVTSKSPHRHLDGLAVAAAAGVLTHSVPFATSVVDTVRRHPAMLAQTALTISHLTKGRFILGLGAGEKENCEPYGFSTARSVSRFDEAVQVIRMLWEAEGPVDFEGNFYRFEHARLDTELYQGVAPPMWIGASGPRMLGIAGRYADGWWPAGMYDAPSYAEKLGVLRKAAGACGRNPDAITPAYMIACLLGDASEIDAMLRQPLLRAFALQMTGHSFRQKGFRHPMGDDWRGILDLEPDKLSRDDLMAFIANVDPKAILANVPHGSPRDVLSKVREYVEAGVRVATILDYGGMAGTRFAAESVAKQAELERLVRENLCGVTL